jgi:CheY-like chemotaxis protein
VKTIIFADDDPTVLDVVTLILEDEYRVVVYPSGDKLLTNEFEKPDLFLLDKQLSGTDGLEICRFLKGQPATRDIPVIMISAVPNIAGMAKAAGADDYIEKPFPIRQLRQLIATYTQ